MKTKDGLRVEEYSKKLQTEVKTFSDYKEMLQNMDIDVVTIAIENGYNVDIYAKLKLLCHKQPIALSTKDAEEMIKISKQNNVKLFVSHQNIFNPLIKKIKKNFRGR